MLLPNLIWFAGLNTPLRTILQTLAAPDTGIRNLIAFERNVSVSNKIGFSENRIYAEIKIFDLSVLDLKHDSCKIAGISGIYI